jgi:hypothetical protein
MPPSPDIDPSVFASSRATPLLVISGFWVPVWLLLTWLGYMGAVRVGGAVSRPETLGEKIAVTILLAAWMAGLLWLHVRHSRRQRAALLALQRTEEPAAAYLRVEQDDARVRVDTPEAAVGDEEAAPSRNLPARAQRSDLR